MSQKRHRIEHNLRKRTVNTSQFRIPREEWAALLSLSLHVGVGRDVCSQTEGSEVSEVNRFNKREQGLGRELRHRTKIVRNTCPPMPRYLLYISYVGTYFRAVQKQTLRAEPGFIDPESVQGILEIACKRFKPANEPQVYVSSRTDQGVHALLSSAHVDLECHSGVGYVPERLTIGFNRYFEKAKVGLRVQKCQQVPDTFHSRHSAKSRTYLYRLAVRKDDAPTRQNIGLKYWAEIPFSEWKRCYFIQNPQFNVELMKQAAALFPGIKDFRSFMRASEDDGEVKTVRNMKELSIQPGHPFLGTDYVPSCKHYDFWEVTCKAQSFLYRQVRRTVAALVAVAQGRITLEDVQYMLDVPSKYSWNPKAETVPAHGLYLVNVEYDPQDLLYERNCHNQCVENSDL